MPYPSDLTEDQWELLVPVFNAPGKRGRKHAPDLRTVVDAMLYIARTGDKHPPGRAAQIAKTLGHDALVLPEAPGGCR